MLKDSIKISKFLKKVNEIFGYALISMATKHYKSNIDV